MDPNMTATLISVPAFAIISLLVLPLAIYLIKCRKIANLTDKLRNSYKREGSDFCVEQWHGLYGAWKILYWRRCSCFSGCSKCCSNEDRQNQVYKYTNEDIDNVSPNSAIAGPSDQRDEDVNNGVENEGYRLMKSPTACQEHVSIQCDRKPNKLLTYEELQIMCKKYEQYDLNRGNFSQCCPKNKCKLDPVILLLLLDWEKVIEYETGGYREDVYCDIFNVALSYGLGSPTIKRNQLIINLLKEKKFTIVILQNFPENWKDIPFTMGLSDKAKIFLKHIKDFVEIDDLYYEYR